MKELDRTDLKLIKYALQEYKAKEGWHEIHKASILMTLQTVEAILNETPEYD